MVTDQYQKYLDSPEWREKRRQRIALSHGQCAVCGSMDALQVHHLTYERLYAEEMADLLPLCREHHDQADLLRKSGLIDIGSHPLFMATETVRLLSSRETLSTETVREICSKQFRASETERLLGSSKRKKLPLDMDQRARKHARNAKAKQMLMAQEWFLAALQGGKKLLRKAIRDNVSRKGYTYGKSWAAINATAWALYENHGLEGRQALKRRRAADKIADEPSVA